MPNTAQLARELPLQGRTVQSGGKTWTVELEGPVTVGLPENTIRTAQIALRGAPDYRLTLRIPGELLVVEHREGDIEWVLDAIRDWLNQPEPKGAHNVLSFS